MAVAQKRIVKLKQMENALHYVSSFLKSYLPLANAHMTDFIVKDWWDKLVPEPIRDELLLLSDSELAVLPSGRLHTTVESRRSQFIDSWDDEDLVICGSAEEVFSGKLPKWDESVRPRWSHKCLGDFIVACGRHSLPNLNVLTDMKDLLGGAQDVVSIEEFMSPKKQHEVEIMTELCAALARKHHLEIMVDIGSGKGYLSSHLALRHDLRVLGIDASSINTGGATSRAQRLGKQWNGLVTRSKKKKQGKHISNNTLIANNQENEVVHATPDSAANKTDKHLTPDSDAKIIDEAITSGSTAKVTTDMSRCTDHKKSQSVSRGRGKFVAITQYVDKKTNIQQLIATHLGSAGHISSDGHLGPAGHINSDGHLGPAGHIGSHGHLGPAGHIGSDGHLGPAGQSVGIQCDKLTSCVKHEHTDVTSTNVDTVHDRDIVSHQASGCDQEHIAKNYAHVERDLSVQSLSTEISVDQGITEPSNCSAHTHSCIKNVDKESCCVASPVETCHCVTGTTGADRCAPNQCMINDVWRSSGHGYDGTTHHGANNEGNVDSSPTDHCVKDHGTTELCDTDHDISNHGNTDHDISSHGNTGHSNMDHVTTELGSTDIATNNHVNTDHDTRDHGTTDHGSTDICTINHGNRNHGITDHGSRDLCTTKHGITDDHLSDDATPYILGGLHACGDLTPDTLRLFVEKSSARVLCNVGCCYHHLTEAFIRCPYGRGDDLDLDARGFPSSDFLLQRGCQLGRNARMLASQTPERIADKGNAPSVSLYWRALLQVILRDVTGELRDDWRVGRIAAKSTDFRDYVQRALHKLHIDNQLSPAAIDEYMSRYEDQERFVRCFVQLKAALAPCIESLIILDRACYLLQQDMVESVDLVQAFDPVISPRCYAIIASKYSQTV